jgi:thiamine-monophosphate kinase
MMSPRPSETGLIARFFAPIAGEGGLALKDDAALIVPRPGHDLVVTVDALVESVHFLPEDAPASIARKALGVNLSDLAGKGAEPIGFVLALALPEDWTETFLADFAHGLGEAARDYGCPLLGGDTVRANGALTLSVTALGQVPSGRMVRRGAALPGDVICVSGTIGDAALGLALRRNPAWAEALSKDERGFLADRYLHPQPRLALAPLLRDSARAAMDVSDGLAGDLAKMMAAGGTTAEVETASVPLSKAARRALAADPDLLDRLLTGGDDYEILCALPQERVGDCVKAAAALGLALTPIGRVAEGERLPVFRSGAAERRFESGSFSHF